MKKFLCVPLYLRRKQKKIWKELNYKCIAVVDNSIDNIKKEVIFHVEKLFNSFSEAFVVIWFFDSGTALPYYSDVLKILTLVSKNDNYLLYKINKMLDIEKIASNWGEYDSLDIIFTKDINDLIDVFPTDFYKSYNSYRKDFMKIIENSDAILSDSGDGEEFQLILSDHTYEFFKSKNYLKGLIIAPINNKIV